MAKVDEKFIRETMEMTFSLRRREVVDNKPMVIEVQERWPALFFKEQIDAEFHCITNKMLLTTFRTAVDNYAPKLLRLYRNQKAAFGKAMEEVMAKLDDETSDILRHRKDAALRGLPVFLREEPKELFKQCLETDADDVALRGVAVGILYVHEDCGPGRSTRVQNIAVILEERIVLQDIPDTPTALAYLFGLLYALNISYPKALNNAIIPKCFKTNTIVPMPEKSSASCLNDYYPIALIPIIMKCFERLIMRHIKTLLPPS
ncbi:uncharacterized protein LOC132894740 [Neoarius graeffei]|uniref:uncharacterized protein LOC132894740 n=1 Tax=Neoarius graeffei TaxID=443677 RepID=UPI00298C0AD9|nr:uncharacterized protein LOC132894740 [Neoarius graeffei]